MSDQLISTIRAFTGTVPGPVAGPSGTAPSSAGNGNPLSASGNGLPPREPEAPVREAPSVTATIAATVTTIGRDLKFIVDLKSAHPIIQVLDSETGEVIRQIPAEELTTYTLESGGESIRLLDTTA